jgi:hypothetical protein
MYGVYSGQSNNMAGLKPFSNAELFKRPDCQGLLKMDGAES